MVGYEKQRVYSSVTAVKLSTYISHKYGKHTNRDLSSNRESHCAPNFALFLYNHSALVYTLFTHNLYKYLNIREYGMLPGTDEKQSV